MNNRKARNTATIISIWLFTILGFWSLYRGIIHHETWRIVAAGTGLFFWGTLGYLYYRKVILK